MGVLAFTLVELLVVIALIGLLAGLLLPVLGRAKTTTQQVKCTGHLRQLGLAAQMYWDDHDGQTFPYRRGATNGGDIYWFGWLARGHEGERAFDPVPGALYPYLGGQGVEICPSLNYALRSFKRKAIGAAYGYGYNLAFSAPPTQAPVKISHVPCLSSLALLADAAQINAFQPPASPDHPMLEEFYYVTTNEATTHFRHQGAANTLFCDGHVEREKPAPGSLDLRLPSQAVGRLRQEILVLP